jgi:cytochrome P450
VATAPRAREAVIGAPAHGTRLPPGPRAPGPVQTVEWMLRPTRFLDRCQERYGDVFSVRLGPARNVVVVGDPHAAKALVSAGPEQCLAGDTNGLFRPVVGSNSILVLDGDRHFEQRRLMLPSFRAGHVSLFADSIDQITRRRIASWPVGEPFALQPEMEAISFETIMRLTFGEGLDARHERLRELVPEMMRRCASPILMLPWFRQDLWGLSPAAKTRRLLRALDDVLFELIAERRADPASATRDDVVSMLATASHQDGSALSDEEIRDEVLTMLMAGYETTTSALAWSFERLLRTPRVLASLVEGIGRGSDVYLDATVKEILRLRPVVPVVARRLRVPFDLNGYTFPAGLILMASIYLAHNDPVVYPDPDELRPERFLPDNPDPAVWIPFGGGARRCLGASLAQLEIKTVLKTVLSAVDLEAVGDREEPVRRRFTLAPKREAMVIATDISLEPEIQAAPAWRADDPARADR